MLFLQEQFIRIRKQFIRIGFNAKISMTGIRVNKHNEVNVVILFLTPCYFYTHFKNINLIKHLAYMCNK